MKRPSHIRIAIITAAHGVRGQVKIRSLATPPEAIFSCGVLSDASEKHIFAIIPHGGMPPVFIASIEGITTRDEAEALKGTELYAPAGALPQLPRDALVGFEARLANGKIYGEVIAAHHFGAGDIIEIKKTDDKTEMLPLNEKFVEIKDDYLIVHPPEYLEAKK